MYWHLPDILSYSEAIYSSMSIVTLPTGIVDEVEYVTPHSLSFVTVITGFKMFIFKTLGMYIKFFIGFFFVAIVLSFVDVDVVTVSITDGGFVALSLSQIRRTTTTISMA